MAKITLLENDVACLKQRNDENLHQGDYHDEKMSPSSVDAHCTQTKFSKEDVVFHTPSRCGNFILDDNDMGRKTIKKEQNNMVRVASNDVSNPLVV
ncbi:hypothetical protein MKW92_012932, partial [Papaver armeniacum]